MFNAVHQTRISLEPLEDVSILDLARSDPREINSELGIGYLYRIECAEGEISFRATGYQQFVRRAPSLVSSQRFSEEQRGGFSFACQTPADPIT